ncbi:MAG: addiction module component CHP02574 family protein [Cytophagales bacterium]
MMRLQIIKDGQGNNTGVFIPIEVWTLIKSQYPDIENVENELPQWEKDLIDSRLHAVEKNTERLKPGKNLFKELKRKI